MTFDGKLIIGIGLGVIAGAVVLLWVIVQIYTRTDNPAVQEHLKPLLYLIDQAADNLEISQKRAQVIIAIQQALMWKRIILPMFVVGLVLDLLVKIIRKVGCPDLHQDKPNGEEAQP